ncbi:MAG: hypothetical protein HRT45_13700 [Bdellovibrionales bacterium]|nr:hypothetical protein [Bdellovibrionales bacterium]
MSEAIDIIFRDAHLCVINKESGHVVHKTRGAGDSPVVLQTLRDQLSERIFPVHRLDRGTSGCLAFAFSSEVASGLQRSMSNGVKCYTALCFGRFDQQSGVYDRELTGESGQKQSAFTKYKVTEELGDYSLLELEIETGRKHQIRRHLSHEAHHIVGDVNHGKGWLNRRFRELYDFHRLFLHCHKLSIVHPVSGERLHCDSPLPNELKGLLNSLRQV